MKLKEKLLEIRKKVPYLQKENDGKQYKYVSSSQVLGAIREEMDNKRVLLVPGVTATNVLPFREIPHDNGKGYTKEVLTEIHLLYKWVDCDSEEIIECPWYGQGLDTGEKGPGKAYTYSEKYFLLKFFNIATDKDDPDSNQDEPTIDNHIVAPEHIIWFGKHKGVKFIDAPLDWLDWIIEQKTKEKDMIEVAKYKSIRQLAEAKRQQQADENSLKKDTTGE